MSAGASAGAAAAAAAERERQLEEEEMATYTSKDLSEDWEFKILRSPMGAFRNPAKLRAALESEKRGGWTLVEKFDDSRIRLKRPSNTKIIETDFTEGYDPYRTRYGATDATIVAIVVGVIAAVLLAVIMLVTLVAR